MAAEENMWIELRALRVKARIGVTDAERQLERPLLIDIDLIGEATGATDSDELADTIDYSRVAARAERVARSAPYRTLERLASEIADAVLDAGPIAEVGVRVAKPDPPMPQQVDHVAVRIARSAREAG